METEIEDKQQIPESFKKWGVNWILIDSNEKAALFEQREPTDDRLCGYVVCKARFSEPGERVMGGATIRTEGGFIKPSESAFGKSAWQFNPTGLKRARAMFEELSAAEK